LRPIYRVRYNSTCGERRKFICIRNIRQAGTNIKTPA
jgi:hypothetical protein